LTSRGFRRSREDLQPAPQPRHRTIVLAQPATSPAASTPSLKWPATVAGQISRRRARGAGLTTIPTGQRVHARSSTRRLLFLDERDAGQPAVSLPGRTSWGSGLPTGGGTCYAWWSSVGAAPNRRYRHRCQGATVSGGRRRRRLLLADSLGHATTRRPRGCSPRPATMPTHRCRGREMSPSRWRATRGLQRSKR
jgi:hypothetical protein